MNPNSGAVPMLATGDMDATVTFYQDALGFDMGDKFEASGTLWWCEMKCGPAKVMLTQHETKVDGPGAYDTFGQTAIAFYINDVEDLHASLVDRGYEPSELRVTFYGMKEFDLRDPTGYTLLIGQPTSESPTVETDAPF
jgi:uncharacterized glyoxalase superfamily protein PhnB